MSGKIPALLALGLLFSACAQPKYEVAPANRAGSVPNQKLENCEFRFASSGHCLQWQWERMPSSTQMGSLIFKTVRPNKLDGSAMPVDPASLPTVVLWMPSMGHGSTPTVVEQIDTGSFRVKNVFFVMPGEWEIRFQIKDGSVVQDEVVVALII